MASCLNCCRSIAHIIADLAIAAAMFFCLAAAFTPAWSTTTINGVEQQTGLFLNCTARNGELLDLDSCSFNTDIKSMIESLGTHLLVICLLILGFVVGLESLQLSCCSSCLKSIGIIWTLCTLIAAGLAMAAVMLFTNVIEQRNSEANPSVKVERGYSFWCAAAACALYFFAFVSCFMSTVLHFCAYCNKRKYYDDSEYEMKNYRAV